MKAGTGVAVLAIGGLLLLQLVVGAAKKPALTVDDQKTSSKKGDPVVTYSAKRLKGIADSYPIMVVKQSEVSLATEDKALAMAKMLAKVEGPNEGWQLSRDATVIKEWVAV